MLGVATVLTVRVPGVGQGNPPDALWTRVEACAAEAKPTPQCLTHSQIHRYVVLRDDVSTKTFGYLLSPTGRVTGIESPRIFTMPILDFWQYAWHEAARYVKRPHAQIGLAINSLMSRRHNQLHIHLTCAKATVIEALAKTKVTNEWQPTPFLTLGKSTFNVRSVESLSGDNSPFKLVAEIPGAKDNDEGPNDRGSWRDKRWRLRPITTRAAAPAPRPRRCSNGLARTADSQAAGLLN